MEQRSEEMEGGDGARVGVADSAVRVSMRGVGGGNEDGNSGGFVKGMQISAAALTGWKNSATYTDLGRPACLCR